MLALASEHRPEGDEQEEDVCASDCARDDARRDAERASDCARNDDDFARRDARNDGEQEEDVCASDCARNDGEHESDASNGTPEPVAIYGQLEEFPSDDFARNDCEQEEDVCASDCARDDCEQEEDSGTNDAKYGFVDIDGHLILLKPDQWSGSTITFFDCTYKVANTPKGHIVGHDGAEIDGAPVFDGIIQRQTPYGTTYAYPGGPAHVSVFSDGW